jgi:hypothetical protein
VGSSAVHLRRGEAAAVALLALTFVSHSRPALPHFGVCTGVCTIRPIQDP